MKFQFPQEIKDVLGALADDTRWNILEAIVNADNKIAYSEIKKVLNVSDEKKGPFNYHLKELQKAGWIRNYIEDKEGTRNKSFYSVSKFAQKVMEGALQAMEKKSYSINEPRRYFVSHDTTNLIQYGMTAALQKKLVEDYSKYVEIEIINDEETKRTAELFGYQIGWKSSRGATHEIRRRIGESSSLLSSKNWVDNFNAELEEVHEEEFGKDRIHMASIKRTRVKSSQT